MNIMLKVHIYQKKIADVIQPFQKEYACSEILLEFEKVPHSDFSHVQVGHTNCHSNQ